MTLLMIPGFMLDSDLWADMEEGLRPYGPVVHADLSQGSTVPEMAKRVLEHAPGDFVAIGFSMGGYIAREIFRQAPDRVKALVLIATSARGDSVIQQQRKASLGAPANPSAFRGLTAAAVATSLHPTNAARLDMISRIQRMGQRLGGDVFYRQSLLDRHDERHRLPSIASPTLVIAGEEDRLRSREEVSELHEGIAGSRFAVVEGTGHMIPLEAPERLVAVVAAWLDDLSAQERQHAMNRTKGTGW